MKSLTQFAKETLSVGDYNTEIRKSHCARCAAYSEAVKGGHADMYIDCPQRGTLHGTPVAIAEMNPLQKLAAYFFNPESLYVRRAHNLITNVGHAAANGRMSNQGSYSPFVNIAIGIGTVAAAVTDTALGSEITTNGGGRGAATATQVTTSVTNDTTQLVKTFTFTGTFAVTEEGILDNAVSGGSLLARQVFSSIGVVSGDSVQFTHKYQS